MKSLIKKSPKEKKGRSKKDVPTPWSNTVEDPENYEGFVYCITRNLDGKYYIGMKFTKSHRRVAQPGKTRKKRICTASDWKHYKSSCKELVADIKQLGVESFTFEILAWYKTRSGVRYAEMRKQVECDVLNDEYSYNANILNRFWVGKIE